MFAANFYCLFNGQRPDDKQKTNKIVPTANETVTLTLTPTQYHIPAQTDVVLVLFLVARFRLKNFSTEI